MGLLYEKERHVLKTHEAMPDIKEIGRGTSATAVSVCDGPEEDWDELEDILVGGTGLTEEALGTEEYDDGIL